MSSPGVPAQDLVKLSSAPPGKATLNDFIDAHSKLATSIAAFVALTAFSTQIDREGTKLYFSSVTFLVALLLVFELLSRFPPAPRQWRLELFFYLLIFMMFSMGEYWVLKFPIVWVPLAVTAVNVLLFFVIPGLLANPITRLIVFAAKRVFKCEVTGKTRDRLLLIVFFACMSTLYGAFLWISHKHPGALITIHFPPGSGNLGK